MFRVILKIIALLTAFASACNPGDIGDGDVRLGGTGDTGSQPAFTTLELSLMARPKTESLDALLAVGGSELRGTPQFSFALLTMA